MCVVAFRSFRVAYGTASEQTLRLAREQWLAKSAEELKAKFPASATIPTLRTQSVPAF
jgi:hypothetical protein